MSENLKITIRKNKVSIVAIVLFFGIIFSLTALPVEAHEIECTASVYELTEDRLVKNYLESIPCPEGETFDECLINAGYSADDRVGAGGRYCHNYRAHDKTDVTDSPSVDEAGEKKGEVVAPITGKTRGVFGQIKDAFTNIKEKTENFFVSTYDEECLKNVGTEKEAVKGQVKTLKGRVFIKKGINASPVKIGAVLRGGDIITTDEDSQVSIRVIETGKIIKVGEKLTFGFPLEKWKKKDCAITTAGIKETRAWKNVSLIYKKLQNLLGKRSFEIESSPSDATAGVRG